MKEFSKTQINQSNALIVTLVLIIVFIVIKKEKITNIDENGIDTKTTKAENDDTEVNTTDYDDAK